MFNHKFKLLTITAILMANLSSANTDDLPEMILYKDPNCGCCTEHGKYLQENGVKVTMVNHPNIVEIKQKYGTLQGASCHTIVMDDYVIEGHVPIASIRKLWNEQPDIKGIALPGMPYNSPGMGPEKKGSLTIMQVKHDNSVNDVFTVE